MLQLNEIYTRNFLCNIIYIHVYKPKPLDNFVKKTFTLSQYFWWSPQKTPERYLNPYLVRHLTWHLNSKKISQEFQVSNKPNKCLNNMTKLAMPHKHRSVFESLDSSHSTIITWSSFKKNTNKETNS